MLLKFRYGGKQGEQYRLQVSNNMLAVRSEDDRLPVNTALSARARRAIASLTPIVDVAHVGVQVFKAPSAATRRARTILEKEKQVRFAGAALRDPTSGAPVLYTENAFVKFQAGPRKASAKARRRNKSRPSNKRVGMADFTISVELLRAPARRSLR